MGSIQEVYSNGLCTGCGTCASVCPTLAIEMLKDEHKGIYIPNVNNGLCNQCGLCLEACPGHSVDFKELNLKIFGKEPQDFLIGNYINCYIGQATDHIIRYNSASGGLVTALLLFALEEGIIDGALITKMNQDMPLEPEVIIARCKEEIISASGSKYCPVPANIRLKNILEEEGKFAVVGLPCHIHGVRKYEMVNEKLQDKIVLHFGLFCASCVTFLGTEYFLQRWGIKKDEVKKINYRGKGWPGKIVVLLKNGEERVISRGTTEKSRFRHILFSSSFHYDFMPPRCLVCPDQACILSDISFGDPWLPELKRTEKVGKSLVISRTKGGDELLQKAASKGIIELVETNIQTIWQAQGWHYKANFTSRLLSLRLLGKPTPDYGSIPLKPDYIYYLSTMLNYLLSYFSSRRYIWSLIYPYAVIRRYIDFSIVFMARVASVRFKLLRLIKRRD